jgi:transcription elongation factor Elf1
MRTIEPLLRFLRMGFVPRFIVSESRWILDRRFVCVHCGEELKRETLVDMFGRGARSALHGVDSHSGHCPVEPHVHEVAP